MNAAEIADLLEGRASSDERAAEAYELFGRCVFPYEGTFLDESVTSRAPLADSLRMQDLPGSLWMWVPAFCCALRDVGSGMGDEVARSLEAVLADVEPSGEAPVFGPIPDLEAPSTDLRSLIEYLATPSRCGFFLSASVLEGMGRSLGVPRGFGPRSRLLRQLLMGASRYERMPQLLSAISAVAGHHHGVMEDGLYLEAAAARAVGPWRDRLALSMHLLDSMTASLSRPHLDAEPRSAAR